MFICVIRIYQQHIRRIMVHIFLRKCLQPDWLQSTFNNTNRSPSQCRASGMEFLCLGKIRLGYYFTPYQRLRLYNGAAFSRL